MPKHDPTWPALVCTRCGGELWVYLDDDAVDCLAALRNAAPALLDMAAECLRLREYARHDESCSRFTYSGGAEGNMCDCGFAALEAPDA